MEDKNIVDLYWSRDESAIQETKIKYGDYCYCIAYRILRNREDADECENDTYLKAWNTMPPKKPEILSTYLGMLCRSCSLSKWRNKNAQKRGGGYLEFSLNELEECIPENKTIHEEFEEKELARILSAFLRKIPQIECDVFLLRYWHFYSIDEICERFSFSKSKVKTMLYRTRNKLKKELESQEVFV